MNKYIKNELNKVKEVSLSFDDNTQEIYIPRKKSIRLLEDHYYIIRLSDFMINPPPNSELVYNWNGGIIPKNRYYKVDINKIMNNMIKVNGMAFDYQSRTDLLERWSGWIPGTEMEVIEELKW